MTVLCPVDNKNQPGQMFIWILAHFFQACARMLFFGWMRSWVFLCLLCWVAVPNISSWWTLQELIGADAGAANSLLPVTLSLQNTKVCPPLVNQLCASLILQEATKREKTWRPKTLSLSYIPALPLDGSRVLTPLCPTGPFSRSYLLSFFLVSIWEKIG